MSAVARPTFVVVASLLVHRATANSDDDDDESNEQRRTERRVDTAPPSLARVESSDQRRKSLELLHDQYLLQLWLRPHRQQMLYTMRRLCHSLRQ